LLRKDQLCEGAKECQEATEVRCTACSTLYQPADIRMPEACPYCSAERQYRRELCDACPTRRLEAAMQSWAGKLLSHVCDLDAMLQCPGFSVSASDIDATEWLALRVLWGERAKFQEDQQKEREREMRQQQLQQQATGRR